MGEPRSQEYGESSQNWQQQKDTTILRATGQRGRWQRSQWGVGHSTDAGVTPDLHGDCGDPERMAFLGGSGDTERIPPEGQEEQYPGFSPVPASPSLASAPLWPTPHMVAGRQRTLGTACRPLPLQSRAVPLTVWVAEGKAPDLSQLSLLTHKPKMALTVAYVMNMTGRRHGGRTELSPTPRTHYVTMKSWNLGFPHWEPRVTVFQPLCSC